MHVICCYGMIYVLYVSIRCDTKLNCVLYIECTVKYNKTNFGYDKLRHILMRNYVIFCNIDEDNERSIQNQINR